MCRARSGTIRCVGRDEGIDPSLCYVPPFHGMCQNWGGFLRGCGKEGPLVSIQALERTYNDSPNLKIPWKVASLMAAE